MKIIQKQLKLILIVLSATIISTLGIFASDELNGVSTRLSGSVINSGSICPNDTTLIALGTHAICIDNYEASPSVDCPYLEPKNEIETLANLAKGGCRAESHANQWPWRFVKYTEAQQLCARAGKRLSTNDEWYRVALGLENPDNCHLSGGEVKQTGSSNCMTASGVHDLVGNLWEWMDEVVYEGEYKGRLLPESGYVSLVDSEGVVIETSAEPNQSFESDYAWTATSGVHGILRGGFYGSGGDGGIFAQNMTVPLDFTAAGVGFRCVKDII